MSKILTRTEPAISFAGEFRLVICDAALRAECERAQPEWSWAQVMQACAVVDTGYVHNVVTDYGRRKLVVTNTPWTTFADLFIHENTNPGNVVVSSLQNVYGTAQVVNPTTNDFDRTTLLQTRTGTFSAVGVSRDINIVGLTGRTSADAAQSAVNGIVAYTKLSSTVVQGPAQTADVQYRVTWSLD